jgi:hypothetical protein
MAPHTFIEAKLDWVIARSGVAFGPPNRRLNAVENILTSLAHPPRPIDPASELRMCEATRDALLAWLKAKEPGAEDVLARLVVYQSDVVIDANVPQGWMRIM